MNIQRTNPAERRGAVAVEFAFVFPLVLLFFSGTLLLTRAALLRDTAQHAAYEGARRGMVITANAAECRNAVEQFLEPFGLKDCEVTVDPPTLSPVEEKVTVTVDIPLSSNAWAITGFIPFDMNLTRSVTLSRQFSIAEN